VMLDSILMTLSIFFARFVSNSDTWFRTSMMIKTLCSCVVYRAKNQPYLVRHRPCGHWYLFFLSKSCCALRPPPPAYGLDNKCTSSSNKYWYFHLILIACRRGLTSFFHKNKILLQYPQLGSEKVPFRKDCAYK
jgi:hypothetical protein